MNLEAVLCMLRTETDGSIVYGVLIRPPTGAIQTTTVPQQAQQDNTKDVKVVSNDSHKQPLCTSVLPSTSCANIAIDNSINSTSVPLSQLKYNNEKLTEQSPFVLEQQPEAFSSVTLTTSVSSSSSSSSGSGVHLTVDSPSPSQVVPQLVSRQKELYAGHSNGSNLPSTSLSKITEQQQFDNIIHDVENSAQTATTNSGSDHSTGELDMLDDLAPLDLAQILAESESILSPECPLLQGASVITSSIDATNHQTSEHQLVTCSTALTPTTYHQHFYHSSFDSNSYTLHHSVPSCRFQSHENATVSILPQHMTSGQIHHPQLDWEHNVIMESSATPDSGIQSIGGSPPSNGVHTPPLISPSTRPHPLLLAGHNRCTSIALPQQQLSPNLATQQDRIISANNSSSKQYAVVDQQKLLPEVVTTSTLSDERPTSSSSSATTSREMLLVSKPLQKRIRRKKKRKGEYADMPHLFPAYKTAANSIEHANYDGANLNLEIPLQVNVSEKISEMDAKFSQVCSSILNVEKQENKLTDLETSSKDLFVPVNSETSICNKVHNEYTGRQKITLECDDPKDLAEKVLSSLKPEQIEQFASIFQSKARLRQPSQANTGNLQIVAAEATSNTECEKLEKLKKYRKKARHIINPNVQQSLIDLCLSMQSFYIDCTQSSRVQSNKCSCFAINFQKILRKIAAQNKQLQVQSGLECEAESGDEGKGPLSESNLVILNQSPQRISLKIKLGSIEGFHRSALEEKKRKKKRKQKSRSKCGSPSKKTFRHKENKSISSLQTNCKVLLQRLSNDNQLMINTQTECNVVCPSPSQK